MKLSNFGGGAVEPVEKFDYEETKGLALFLWKILLHANLDYFVIIEILRKKQSRVFLSIR